MTKKIIFFGSFLLFFVGLQAQTPYFYYYKRQKIDLNYCPNHDFNMIYLITMIIKKYFIFSPFFHFQLKKILYLCSRVNKVAFFVMFLLLKITTKLAIVRNGLNAAAMRICLFKLLQVVVNLRSRESEVRFLFSHFKKEVNSKIRIQ
jgi:hypothetical protein